MSHRAIFAVAVASTLFFFGSAARAEHPLVRLEVTRRAGTEHCPEDAQLRDAVTVRLGYDPFDTLAVRVIRVTIERRDGALVGDVDTLGEDGKVVGERHLRSLRLDCHELVAAITLTVSIAIDAVAHPAPPAPPPPPAAPPPAPPPAPAPALPAPPSPAPAPPPLTLRAGADTIALFGSAPSTNLGLLAFVGLARPWWSLDLEAEAAFPLGERSLATGSISADLYAAQLVPCVRPEPFAICFVAALGALHADGTGFSTNEHPTSVYAHASLRAGLEWPLGPTLFLRGHGELGTPLARTSFVANGREQWISPVVDGAIGLGVGFRR